MYCVGINVIFIKKLQTEILRRYTSMKKLIVISAAALMALAAVGCRTNEDTADNTPAPTTEAVSTAAGEPTAAADTVDSAIIEAAWAAVEKIEQVHEQQFDKAKAAVQTSADSSTVRFPSVNHSDEVLCVTVEKDESGSYKANWESIYAELAEGATDDLNANSDAIGEKQEEFRNANITVTADDVRAFGCGAEIGSSDYKAAVAAIYGEKLAEYYRGSLTEDSPFYCYDIRCVGTELNKDHQDSYDVIIGFRVRDILPFSHLFGYGPIFDSGAIHTDYEGWLVGCTLIEVTPDSDGSFVANAELNSAG